MMEEQGCTKAYRTSVTLGPYSSSRTPAVHRMGNTRAPICCGSALACRMTAAEQGTMAERLQKGGATYLRPRKSNVLCNEDSGG